MILKTVLNKIKESPHIPFERYFTEFVMNVQDQMLDREISLSKSKMNVDDLQELIESIYRGLPT